MKTIKTLRFGEIEIDETKIVHFETGIPAFEEEHEFVVIPYDEESPYLFLQSAATPDLAFLMTNPFLFFPDYAFELDDASQEALGIKEQDDMELYVLLTLPGGSVPDMTANLMAPVVIGNKTMHGKQIVLEKSPYTTKERLFPKKEEKA
ncbi:flagellar assembly protein FliW [Mitsuokella sp. oral taxon 131]|uniref:flagellar assembly protein FliW n=1 Tax=Mitsuokella sp. oral taxon 131 TaxID=1321780 RepID=UPI000425BD54|nr:flagellar assembly protein FliW [Mitsuokella sp. oral taxon 131]